MMPLVRATSPIRHALPGALTALALAALQGCASLPQTVSPAAASPAARPADSAATTTAQPVPAQVQADLDAAMALVRAERHEQAAEAFNKLALALPGNVIPVINLALVYKALDKPELAEAQLKQALALEPDNPVAANELALLHRQAGRFVEARAVYEKVLAKYPHFAMAHKNLGVLCDLYLKDYPCAIDHYRSYASSARGDKSAEMWIADLQKRTGKKEGP
jgi:tetratricopeptide (TPR) repeat protein